jgi:hypothetical protein
MIQLLAYQFRVPVPLKDDGSHHVKKVSYLSFKFCQLQLLTLLK